MRNREMHVIPEDSKAAGLIVPDPSISSFPMPLSDLETEGVVWYMAPSQRAGSEAAEGRFGAAFPDPPGLPAGTHNLCTSTQLSVDGCVVCDAAMRRQQ